MASVPAEETYMFVEIREVNGLPYFVRLTEHTPSVFIGTAPIGGETAEICITDSDTPEDLALAISLKRETEAGVSPTGCVQNLPALRNWPIQHLSIPSWLVVGPNTQPGPPIELDILYAGGPYRQLCVG
ncbi:MAG: hypothetical protein A2Y57_02300 [Candidatus Woykebacteria bacterium RBG_13_40_7b]|uniref:Uncharacterized protein n=1 Tax=Candidatus Woykebacteria bacterium RBG_13_40_7b TaxID=1802594 RepID=A0A1G1WB65_9BACT|nr:MAG: hypothetical protein A2Y57_02300 [Candidatus Woykebacteria bacterium RBG_13_40_7b]